MKVEGSEVRGAEPSGDLRRARALARILDSAVGVPGTPLRIGLDAVLGLIPGAGDIVGAALSGYIVLTAARNGAPGSVLGRMLLNVVLDTVIGAVPVLGDLFDIGYKSNMKNVELLERFTARPAEVTKGSRRAGVAIVILVLLALAGLATGAVLLTAYLWRALAS
jgi:hypothetical protein